MYFVQYVAWAVFLLMMLFTIYDFKKSVIFWVPFHLLFNSMIALLFSPGIAVGVAVNIMQTIFYLIFVRKDKEKYGCNTEPFWLKGLVGMTIITFLYSILFASVPISTTLIPSVKYFILGFFPFLLIQRVLNDENDIKLLLKYFKIVTVLIVGLGAIESVLHDNPLLDFIYLTSPEDELEKGRMSYVPPLLFDYATNERYGLRRCYSFFGLHLEFGFACACLFFLYTFLYVNKWIEANYKSLLVFILLCLAGVFFSNSKQAILSVCIMMLALFSLKDLFHVKIVAPILIGIVTIAILAPSFFLNFVSIVDEDVAAEGGGSSVALRHSQLAIMLKLFIKNPITGVGPGGNAWYVFNESSVYGGLFGSESIWLLIPSERGLLGVAMYLLLFVLLWEKLKMFFNKRVLFFLLFSIFVTESAGGLKDMMMWSCVVVVVYRLYVLRNENNVINLQ